MLGGEEISSCRLGGASTTLPDMGPCAVGASPLSWYRVNVKTLPTLAPQKARPTTTGTLVGTRFQATLLEAVDEWRKKQPDLPTRPEAVRRLVEIGMAGRPPKRRPGAQSPLSRRNGEAE